MHLGTLHFKTVKQCVCFFNILDPKIYPQICRKVTLKFFGSIYIVGWPEISKKLLKTQESLQNGWMGSKFNPDFRSWIFPNPQKPWGFLVIDLWLSKTSEYPKDEKRDVGFLRGFGRFFNLWRYLQSLQVKVAEVFFLWAFMILKKQTYLPLGDTLGDCVLLWRLWARPRAKHITLLQQKWQNL